jgi:flavin reductase (DIM6/NTAB) family NADH-FMN oxidoreductase RutF
MLNPLPSLFASLTHGVFVIGVASGERRNAFTAAWVMQASFDPPILALSINPRHSSYRLMTEGRAFTVNVLACDQLSLAEHFGQPAAVDKLATVAWQPAGSGAPLLDAALAIFDCRLQSQLEAGDHVIVTGLVVGGGLQRDGAQPLQYRDTGAMDGSAALFPSGFPEP